MPLSSAKNYHDEKFILLADGYVVFYWSVYDPPPFPPDMTKHVDIIAFDE